MKVVIKRMDRKTARQIGAEGSVGKRRVADEGGARQLWTLDLAEDSFEDDLTYVFGRNVEKARRENKRVTGSRDGIAA